MKHKKKKSVLQSKYSSLNSSIQLTRNDVFHEQEKIDLNTALENRLMSSSWVTGLPTSAVHNLFLKCIFLYVF